MFELKITDIDTAVYLSEMWATHIVSLLDPDSGSHSIILPEGGKDSLLRRYYFHDITELDDLMASFFANPTLATYDQVENILDFTAQLQSSDKLLVHCHAGISRSTAVACGVLCQHGLSPNEAVKYVLSIRPQAEPNEHVLRLFDEILVLNRKLVEAGIPQY